MAVLHHFAASCHDYIQLGDLLAQCIAVDAKQVGAFCLIARCCRQCNLDQWHFDLTQDPPLRQHWLAPSLIKEIDANMEAHLAKQAESSPEFEFEAMEQLHAFWNRKLPIVMIPDHLFDSNKKGVVGREKQFDRKALES